MLLLLLISKHYRKVCFILTILKKQRVSAIRSPRKGPRRQGSKNAALKIFASQLWLVICLARFLVEGRDDRVISIRLKGVQMTATISCACSQGRLFIASHRQQSANALLMPRSIHINIFCKHDVNLNVGENGPTWRGYGRVGSD